MTTSIVNTFLCFESITHGHLHVSSHLSDKTTQLIGYGDLNTFFANEEKEATKVQ